MVVIEASRAYTNPGNTSQFADWLTAPAAMPTGVPGEPGTDILANLRRDLGLWLAGHPRREDAIDIMVELLTNALRHGSRPGGLVTLLVKRLDGGRLEVCVGDSGRAASEAPRITTPGLGRGLRMVKALSKVTQTDRATGGRTVRAVLAATPPPVIEPDIDVDALLAEYPDGDDNGDAVTGGGDHVS